WTAGAPANGFSPTGASWLPQPDSFALYAADVQVDDPSSTLELYRTALRLRRELRLGEGKLEWAELGPDVVAFRNGSLLVLTNLGAEPVALPEGAQVRLRSGSLDAGGRVPTDVTVWVEE
ncbi:MAG: alpha-amylase, partial [Pseudonocardia sp.]|nr:alpha-amylase [Pseudonocardia sp.]